MSYLHKAHEKVRYENVNIRRLRETCKNKVTGNGVQGATGGSPFILLSGLAVCAHIAHIFLFIHIHLHINLYT